MRGTVNKAPVLAFVGLLSFVHAVYDVGILALRHHPYLACSPDAVALVKSDASMSDLLQAHKDVHFDGETFWIAPVEIKTKVAASPVEGTLPLISTDLVFCSIGDDKSCSIIPREHLMQVIQQATVLNSSFAMYIVASETGMMYTVVSRIPT